MPERNLLLGWTKTCAYAKVSRLLMVHYDYPVYDCDRAVRHGYGVRAYTDEPGTHKTQLERLGEKRGAWWVSCG